MYKNIFLLLVFILPIYADLPEKLKKNRKAGVTALNSLAKLDDTAPKAAFF